MAPQGWALPQEARASQTKAQAPGHPVKAQVPGHPVELSTQARLSVGAPATVLPRPALPIITS